MRELNALMLVTDRLLYVNKFRVPFELLTFESIFYLALISLNRIVIDILM